MVIVLTCFYSSSHSTKISKQQLLLRQNVPLEIIEDYCEYKEYVRGCQSSLPLFRILLSFSYHMLKHYPNTAVHPSCLYLSAISICILNSSIPPYCPIYRQHHFILCLVFAILTLPYATSCGTSFYSQSFLLPVLSVNFPAALKSSLHLPV